MRRQTCTVDAKHAKIVRLLTKYGKELPSLSDRNVRGRHDTMQHTPRGNLALQRYCVHTNVLSRCAWSTTGRRGKASTGAKQAYRAQAACACALKAVSPRWTLRCSGRDTACDTRETRAAQPRTCGGGQRGRAAEGARWTEGARSSVANAIGTRGTRHHSRRCGPGWTVVPSAASAGTH
jgi:hypothetical protein